MGKRPLPYNYGETVKDKERWSAREIGLAVGLVIDAGLSRLPTTTYCVRARRLRLDCDQRQDFFTVIFDQKTIENSLTCKIVPRNILTALCALPVKEEISESQDIVVHIISTICPIDIRKNAFADFARAGSPVCTSPLK